MQSFDNRSKTGNFSAESKSYLCFDQYAHGYFTLFYFVEVAGLDFHR